MTAYWASWHLPTRSRFHGLDAPAMALLSGGPNSVLVMGIYGDRILPHIVDKACGVKTTHPLRQRVCSGLHGDVLEIGFGSGNNVAFYPPTVNKVVAIEPSDTAWRIAGKRVGASPVRIERGELDAQRLPYPDATFDSAVSTWTLCTIPDPVAALYEVRRVLKPGGELHFVEHGLAPDPKVQRWQHRFNGVQRFMFGGCNLNRPIAELLQRSGLRITELDEFYEQSAPKFVAADSLGTAVA
jgi:ubiquinone/menaquinone biosynthesis C-methylase UbiE